MSVSVLNPEIRSTEALTLVGIAMRMNMADRKTFVLWNTFMPLKHQITYSISTDLYNVRIYDSLEYFTRYDANNEFINCAALSVNNTENIPDKMEVITVPAGLYAVFNYRGAPSQAAAFYAEIFQQWLPSSAYTLDERPHFEVMGDKYKGEDPSSEEEIWIPVKLK